MIRDLYPSMLHSLHLPDIDDGDDDNDNPYN